MSLAHNKCSIKFCLMKVERWEGLGQIQIFKAVGRNLHFIRLYFHLIVGVPRGDNISSIIRQGYKGVCIWNNKLAQGVGMEQQGEEDLESFKKFSSV